MCCWISVCIGCFCKSYIVSNHIFDTDHCRQIEGRCQLSPNISFKLLGFLKAKTGGSLKILHSSGCICIVVQCSRTMLDKLYVMINSILLFVFFSLYWMRSFLSIPLAMLKQWLMLALLKPLFFRWHFSSPRRFLVVCSLGQMCLIRRAWLHEKLLLQCFGWQLCGDRYWCLDDNSVGTGTGV